MAMVAVGELGDDGINLFAISEETAVARLFCQDSLATLNHPFGMQISNEVEDRGDAPERQFAEKLVDPTFNPPSGSVAPS